MESNEFPTRYEPSGEQEQYRRWEAAGCFRPADDARSGQAFSMVLPPPNVTGTLHVGHAVMLAIEDMMVRYHRMKGDRTLWIPGLDHAAIATQNVVEKKLKKGNVQHRRTRHELGREAFLQEVEVFVEQSKARIIEQTKAMGASLDWSRLAYTLDEQRSHAVQTMFKKMYDAGVLYRGNRIVNWCPRCKSTLADDEVNYKEEKTPFYYFKYGPVVIGTARPETKFQDKTLVVHPGDERYAHLVGTTFEVPWIEDAPLTANVIADPVIDQSFGTGAMTITPAHSFEDFALARQHELPVVIIIDEEGNLTAAAGSFAGRNAREARADIVAVLQQKGLVEHIDENYTHNLSVCYRCETPVEPLPKLQWFVDVNKQFRDEKSLKDLALNAVRSGAIEIVPERFTKEYFHWMENLRDWCISRQIWFGHRIPAWYRNDEMRVGVDAPEGEGWEQDPDTLDTWFSSGMWTFSTLGWPEEAEDLKTFHPTSVLETGYDILFFWVARMILMTEFALGTVPFKQVYLHGLVRDSKGRKMSKSIGNVIDPLDMVGKYGADATRLALFIGTSPGQDTKLDEQKIAGYAKFVTKIWNIARYVQLTLQQEMESKEQGTGSGELGIADHWILAKRAELVRDVTRAYEQHEYSRAAQSVYDFAWHEFADWYIEATKVASNREQQKVLLETLEIILKLLHPAMPFVTEELWKRLGHTDVLMIAAWPSLSVISSDSEKSHTEHVLGDAAQAEMFTFAQEIATAIRQVRNEAKIAPKIPVRVTLAPSTDQERAWCAAAEVQQYIAHFGRAATVDIGAISQEQNCVTVRAMAIGVQPVGNESA